MFFFDKKDKLSPDDGFAMDTHGDGDKNNDVDDGIYDPKTSGFRIDKKRPKKVTTL